MGTHRQSSFLEPDVLDELQGLFDSAWQEFIRDHEVLPDQAERLRRELAQSILSMRELEPEVIRRTAVQSMRRSIDNGATKKC
jgi:hypothetical protein